MSCTSNVLLSPNGCVLASPKPLGRFLSAKRKLFVSVVRASSDDPDCNAEECAPDKEVGTVSMEWLAGEKTKVVGTFPPRKRGWTGYVEKDTAGQTNVYSIEEGKEVVRPFGGLVWSLGEDVSKRSLLALVSASLFFVDPALAFKGGGPYGQGVTRGQDLSGKDFSGQTLIRQDFKTSILRQANFKGAKLLGASFFDADLTGADLSETDLRGADFSLANVTKVNLTNANLEGATATGNTSFKGSNITGADFTDVPLRDDQREYLCKIADGVNATTGNATRDTLLCN